MDYINEKPLLRGTISLMLTVIIGVFSSLFTIELSPGGVVDWSLFTSLKSFWFLSFSVLVSIVFNYIAINYDNNVLRFSSLEYCKAHVAKTNLEAYSRNIKKNPENIVAKDINSIIEFIGKDK